MFHIIYFNGIPLLHQSCKGGCIDIVKFLVEKECNIDEIDSKGNTPIRVSLDNGYFDIYEYLVTKGANTKYDDPEEITMINML